MTPARFCRPLAAVVLAAAAGTLAAQEVRPAGDARAFDKAVVDALRDAHNRGADLYNTAKDFGGAYRLYQGSLVAVRPLLTHRPDALKLIDDGVAESDKEADVAAKAFKLHLAIEGVRAHLKTAPPLPDPVAAAAKKAADDATAAAEKKVAADIKAAEQKVADAAAEARKLADGLKAAEKKGADDKAALEKKLADAAAEAKKLADAIAAAEKKLVDAEAAVKKLADEKAALEKKLADAAKTPPKATPPTPKVDPKPKAPPTTKSSGPAKADDPPPAVAVTQPKATTGVVDPAPTPKASGPAGKVTVKGEPLPAGDVILVSLDLPKPRVFVAAVTNGAYAVAAAVPAGKYLVLVTGKGVPDKYATATTSGLRVEVKAGGTFDFDLM